MHSYVSSVDSLLASSLFKEMPLTTRNHLQTKGYHWGQWILLLSPGDRKELSDSFLAPYRDFALQFAKGWRGAEGGVGGERSLLGVSPGTTAATGGGGGLYVLVSPHLQGACVAHELAVSLGVPVLQPKDVKDFVVFGSVAGVVFVLVTDGQAMRLVRELHNVPLKSIAVTVCLLDVSALGATRSLQHQGLQAKPAESKKFQSMTSTVLGKVEALCAAASANHSALQKCDIVWSSPSSAAGDASPDLDLYLARCEEGGGGGVVAACEEMQRCMARARESLVSSHKGRERQDECATSIPAALAGSGESAALGLAPLHVVMFVTMVGWGKNALCESLQHLSAAAEGGRGGLEQQLGLPEGARACVLEGDALGGHFWNEVGRQARCEQVHLLILNRNFPPNSWEPSCRKIMQAVAGQRAVRFVALVPAGCHDASTPACHLAPTPESPHAPTTELHLVAANGALRAKTANGILMQQLCGGEVDRGEVAGGHWQHPFGLVELAVCMQGVLERRGHASKLDGHQCSEASKVVSSFFNYYSGIRGGRCGLMKHIRRHLTTSILNLDWLEAWSGHELAASPELASLRHQVQLLSHPAYSLNFTRADEERLRECYSSEAARNFLCSARVDVSLMAASFVSQLRLALDQGKTEERRGGASDKAKGPSYVGLSINEDDMALLVQSLSQRLARQSTYARNLPHPIFLSLMLSLSLSRACALFSWRAGAVSRHMDVGRYDKAQLECAVNGPHFKALACRVCLECVTL